ncbi:Solute carrier family 25 member 35-like isoform X2 [Oopsacas minuta]|uniref:Solute carrier family 25 member 35-like isoform X2 n=1 Tax=Oopsacas minuta TaxID=111878 RepID=A0AAV7K6C4_9METZ|nr:Solute carrier family 25 member 35-like isoform X2 [Oopsacas minuta]
MNLSEFLLGGLSAVCAGLFTNPLEVIKTRLQLQGELRAHGTYKRHYRNTLQAFYKVARTDGIYSIQKGLGPALMYQAVMNSVRLGSYQVLLDTGAAHDDKGRTRLPVTIAFGAIAGCMGSFMGSPFYQVKIHLQAQSAPSIAVGYQRSHTSATKALWSIFKQHGISGLWRGATGAMVRVTLGSAAQLSTFSNVQSVLSESLNRKITDISVLIASSFVSGLVVCLVMTPSDVICTRLYNQKVDTQGKGVTYKGILDCGRKILKNEGLKAFYKGLGPHYIRIGPHTLLCLVFWGKFRHVYQILNEK